MPEVEWTGGDLPNFVTHLECGLTGERYEAVNPGVGQNGHSTVHLDVEHAGDAAGHKDFTAVVGIDGDATGDGAFEENLAVGVGGNLTGAVHCHAGCGEDQNRW